MYPHCRASHSCHTGLLSPLMEWWRIPACLHQFNISIMSMLSRRWAFINVIVAHQICPPCIKLTGEVSYRPNKAITTMGQDTHHVSNIVGPHCQLNQLIRPIDCVLTGGRWLVTSLKSFTRMLWLHSCRSAFTAGDRFLQAHQQHSQTEHEYKYGSR
ncbi:hypothetical protein M752DRAFT_3033 [Aspergillus phoenicis ATCC 13157]|uniref:Uncharacterized protein n=1 Tax=Aspergillus phoenicis ATCC 13157 TaxID=1353007 RepID=A0A370Q0B1_ASPPH|nr:hypothetical protein M752DRAFT_3033 [Aspergillus phoenicis ATCC 13157]